MTARKVGPPKKPGRPKKGDVKVRQPILALTVLDQDPEMPSGELLKKLGVDNQEDYADFIRCLRIIGFQMQSYTLKDACAEVNLVPRTLYETRWQELMAKARRVHAGPLMSQVQTQANYVFNKWPEIIKSLVNVAINGGRDHEKVAATELLYQMYVLPVQQTPQDDTAEREYLSKPKNFNPQMPMTPIQVNEGGTVNIINPPKE